MKLEHFAIAANSEEESDKFFIDLLGLKKVRTFIVSNEKMKKFFDVDETHNFIRYENKELSVEVIITNKNEQAKDKFTHVCIKVKDDVKLLEKASVMGYETVKVPRNIDDQYYLFIKDSFGNLFEIKEL